MKKYLSARVVWRERVMRVPCWPLLMAVDDQGPLIGAGGGRCSPQRHLIRPFGNLGDDAERAMALVETDVMSLEHAMRREQ